MNLQRLACTLFMMTTMALAGCGGGGGGGSMAGMMETPTPTPDGGSMMDDDMMMGGGTGPGTSACAIGPVSGSGCTHTGGGSSFTFTINEDGSACIGGICSGRSISINNFSAMRNADGTWEITALPGVGTPGDGMMTSTGSPFGVPSDSSITNGSSMAIAEAAGNEPVQGSITQSSDGTNAVSDDTVGVEVTSENGQLMYDVSYDGTSIVSTKRGQAVEGVEFIYDRPKGTELFERVEEENGVEFYRSLRAGEAETGSVAGDLWVDVYTDYEGTNDTDYLAGGIWVFVPDTATSLADYEFGAFADGNDPFAQSALPALTGTATYEGEATGVYSEDGRNWFFDAAATLMANFDGGTNNLGTISGRIYDADLYGVRELGDNFDVYRSDSTLHLGTANIGDTEAGFFTGNTSMTNSDGDTFTGKWGGQFYGNGESDGKPGSVAGTFGAATMSGDQSLLGAFGAYKQ